MNEADKILIRHLSGDLGDSLQPLTDLALKLGRPEAEALADVERFKAQGLIRRFGFTISHQRSGFTANALIAWRAAEGRLDEVGARLAARPQVSHCYRRRTVPGWPYDLYTMVHAADREELLELAREMAAEGGVTDWRILESLAELKKTSRLYFAESDESI